MIIVLRSSVSLNITINQGNKETIIMVDIQRINFLAKKAREQGLTEEEKKEQAALRKAYVDSVIGDLKNQLDNTYILEPDGTKVKVSQKEIGDDKKEGKGE